MYYRHFGLTGAPFQFTPTARMLFISRSHRDALAALEWSLAHEPSGFTLMLGETGAGKTTLLVALMARNQGGIHIACVTNPRLGFDGIMRDLLRQLGIAACGAQFEMAEAFDRFLSGLPAGDRVVVMIDEAQSLAADALEDLRLFANRADGEGARLHFVLAGQPDLARRLGAPELRQVNDRIGIRTALQALDRDESAAYVAHRVAACGGTVAELFTPGALEHLLEHSGGNPRRINVLCHNAMLAAWNAGEPRVTLAIARAAALASGFANGRAAEARRGGGRFAGLRLTSLRAGSIRPVAALAAMAFFGLAAVYLWQGDWSGREEPTSIEPGGVVGDAVTEHPGAGYISTIPSGATDPGGLLATAPGPGLNDRSAADGAAGRGAPAQVRVRPGDTLAGIAARYLGSKDQVDRLVGANPRLGDANRIYAGEFLNLPAAARRMTAASRGVVTPTAGGAADRRALAADGASEEE